MQQKSSHEKLKKLALLLDLIILDLSDLSILQIS